MAIGPERVLSAWRARFIKQTLLRHQHERTLRDCAAGNVALGVGNFFNRPAEMNGAGAATPIRFPRNWRRQRVIDFENSRRVFETFQPAAITVWQLIADDPRELPDRCIQNSDARFWKLIQVFDASVDLDLAAELDQIFNERV